MLLLLSFLQPQIGGEERFCATIIDFKLGFKNYHDF